MADVAKVRVSMVQENCQYLAEQVAVILKATVADGDPIAAARGCRSAANTLDALGVLCAAIALAADEPASTVAEALGVPVERVTDMMGRRRTMTPP